MSQREQSVFVRCEACDGHGDLRIHGCDDSTCGPCDGTGKRLQPPVERADRSRWFLVVSAEECETVPILDDGSGPLECGHDVLWVRAASAKRAKVLMVRAWRRRTKRERRYGPDWLTGGNPFRGMQAIRASNLPDWEVPLPSDRDFA